MKAKTSFILICHLILGLLAAGSGDCNSQEKPAATNGDSRAGCTGCHEKLAELLPKGHFKTKSDSLQYCLICHSSEGSACRFNWTIHFYHYAASEFSGDCSTCHLRDLKGFVGLPDSSEKNELTLTQELMNAITPYFQSWASSEHLDRLHAKHGVTCMTCHRTFLPKNKVATSQCQKCHGTYESLASMTSDISPANPHKSHLGEMKCSRCHKAHKESSLYCNKCHVFELKTP